MSTEIAFLLAAYKILGLILIVSFPIFIYQSIRESKRLIKILNNKNNKK